MPKKKNHKFQAPEPVEPWAPNVLDAIEPGFTCIRPAIVPYIEPTPQDEDCLSMNIFVPGMELFLTNTMKWTHNSIE